MPLGPKTETEIKYLFSVVLFDEILRSNDRYQPNDTPDSETIIGLTRSSTLFAAGLFSAATTRMS